MESYDQVPQEPHGHNEGDTDVLTEHIPNTRVGPLRERLPMFFSEENRRIFCNEVFTAHGINDEQIDSVSEAALHELTPLIASYFDKTTLEERKKLAEEISSLIKNSL